MAEKEILTKFKLSQEWYAIDDLLKADYEWINKHKYKIMNIPCVFDIETTSFYENKEKRATMYAWVFGMNGKCVRGRSWNEFKSLIDKLVKRYELNTKKRLAIYVHNLSFEFQWIRKMFEWDEVFSVEDRKPIYALTSNGIMFRCSYLLSGYSLDLVGKRLHKYKVRKMVGDLNYELPRNCNTPLTDKEWEYIKHDGLVVMAYIQEEIERLGDIGKLPNTKTGYVRNMCRDNCFAKNNIKDYKRIMKRLTLTPSDYGMLRQVFSGGFTHANHKKVGRTITDVASFDFTSSYPAVILSEKFPMGKPNKVQVNCLDDFEMYTRRYACMFNAIFFNIYPRNDNEHYISRAKCWKCVDGLFDNGRVISANELCVTLTEIDYEIIKRSYRWDRMMIGDMRIMTKDYLPKPFLDSVLTLYEKKTILKGVKGRESEYMVSKEMLNSCYGMCVTDICRADYIYDNDKEWHTEECDAIAEIDRYNNEGGRFLFYAWGVWITAYARFNLYTAQEECNNDYLYSDTDSIKITNKEKHMGYFNNYNRMITEKVKKCLTARGLDYSRACPKTIKGISKQIGAWDYEGTYRRFKTLGAKRYIYEDNNNELHITIAGVNKQTGKDYLLWKYNNNDEVFRHFKNSLVFPAVYENNGVIKRGAGKLLHTYIDEEEKGVLTDYLGNSYPYHELSAIHLEPTSYELSMEKMFYKYILYGYRDGSLLI